MKIVFAILALALMSCNGCSHAKIQKFSDNSPKLTCMPPELVGVTNRYPKEWIEATRAGIEYWNEVTGLELFHWAGVLSFNADDEHISALVLIDIDTETPNCGTAKRVAQVFQGRICTMGAVIRVNPKCVKGSSIERLETLARHEAGHVLGFGHSKFQLDVMFHELLLDNEDWPHPREASEQEIEQLRNMYKYRIQEWKKK